jgi:hypothetical protein
MLTSRRDYILRIIDEVSRLLARVVFKRRGGESQEALQTVVQACERLFAMDADKLFQLSPDQHYAMLVEGEQPEIARNKALIYAALNAEAGRLYRQLQRPELARAAFLAALRVSLKARAEFPATPLPEFAPDIPGLIDALAGEPLDDDTAALVKTSRGTPAS